MAAEDIDAMTTVGTGASGPVAWKPKDKEACKMLATMLMGNMPRAATGPARVLRGQMIVLAKVLEDLITDSDKVDAVSAMCLGVDAPTILTYKAAGSVMKKSKRNIAMLNDEPEFSFSLTPSVLKLPDIWMWKTIKRTAKNNTEHALCVKALSVKSEKQVLNAWTYITGLEPSFELWEAIMNKELLVEIMQMLIAFRGDRLNDYGGLFQMKFIKDDEITYHIPPLGVYQWVKHDKKPEQASSISTGPYKWIGILYITNIIIYRRDGIIHDSRQYTMGNR